VAVARSTLLPGTAPPAGRRRDRRRARLLHPPADPASGGGGGPVSVMQLAADLDLTTAGVRRHVAALVQAGRSVPTPRRCPDGPDVDGPRDGTSPPSAAPSSRRRTDLAAQAGFLACSPGTTLSAPSPTSESASSADDTPTPSSARVRMSAPGVGAAAGLPPTGSPPPSVPCPAIVPSSSPGALPCPGRCHPLPATVRGGGRLFSTLLGVHVQRLSTLAAGGHVCTRRTFPRPSPTSARDSATAEGTR
jgi:hypothetical protein